MAGSCWAPVETDLLHREQIAEEIELVTGYATANAHHRARVVERRLLAGENVVIVRNPQGGTTEFHIPVWWRHPLDRARIAIARWRYRRDPDA